MKLRLKVTLQLRGSHVDVGTILDDSIEPFPSYVNEESLADPRYFDVLDVTPADETPKKIQAPAASKANTSARVPRKIRN
jgi:hypothetical protein